MSSLQGWFDFLGNVSGYKQKYDNCHTNFIGCLNKLSTITADYNKALEKITQLEKLVPRPDMPELTNIVEKDTAWVQNIISKMEADIVRLPLGVEFRLTDKTTFIDFIAWSWIDQAEYHKFYRCGNFSIALKADADKWGVNQVGIVLDYVSGHAYNLVIFPDGKVMLLEPQSDNLFIWQEHAPQFYNLKGAFVVI